MKKPSKTDKNQYPLLVVKGTGADVGGYVVVEANKVFCDLLKIKPAHILGKKLLDLSEYKFITPTGKPISTRATKAICRTKTRQLHADITKTTHPEIGTKLHFHFKPHTQTARKSTTRAKTIFTPPDKLLTQNPFMGVFTVEVRGKNDFVFSGWNNQYLKLTGLKAADLKDRPLEKIFSAHDHLVMLNNFKKIVASKSPAQFEELLFLPRGRVWWQIFITPEIKNKKVVRLHGCVQDITEQKNLQQELQENEHKTRALMGCLPDAVFRLSRHGIILSMEEGKDTIIGLPPEKLIGVHVRDVLPDEAAAMIEKSLARSWQTKRTQISEYQYTVANSRYDFEIRIIHVDESEALAIVRDITRRKRAEHDLRIARDQAEIANRAKSAFLSNIGHELRTPLNAIIGFSEIIHKELFGPLAQEKYRSYAGHIHNSGEKLLDMINDIIDLSMFEKGLAELHEEGLDLDQILNNAIKVMQDRLHTDQVKITNNLDHQLLADRHGVGQILINVLSNAMKFGNGHHIHLETKLEPSGGITIAVHDRGTGMAEEDIAIALTAFSEDDPTITRDNEGVGLGLPLVKSIMELHGGTIKIKSELGTGTTVELRFPTTRTLENKKSRSTKTDSKITTIPRRNKTDATV